MKLKPNSENHWRKFQAKNSETKIQKNIGQIGHKKLDTKRSTKQSTKLDTGKIPVREAHICSDDTFKLFSLDENLKVKLKIEGKILFN